MSERKGVLGTDLRLRDDGEGADLVVSPTGDLVTTSFELNLGQAILGRFRTRKGELRELGHETLGSRLYEFVGEPNNERTRERLRAVVRQTLSEEPRIKEIVKIDVRRNLEERNRLDVNISVIPIGQETPLNIVMPFYLEVA